MPLIGTGRGVAVRMDLLNEQQAQRNHGQTLARLAERGGLSPCEAVAIAERRKWHRMAAGDALDLLARLANGAA
jgi:hypothetical protein